MGMAKLLLAPEGEDQKESKRQRIPVIDYMTDFMFGFFVVPSTHFIATTTVQLMRNPATIDGGPTALYIAMLTAIYYILSKKAEVAFQTRWMNFLFIALGVCTFLILYSYL